MWICRLWLCWIMLVLAPWSAWALAPNDAPGEPGSWDFRPFSGQEATTNPPSFTWRPIDGATGYVLEVAADAAFSEAIFRVDATEWSAYQPDRALAPGTYYWRYALQLPEGGTSAWSEVRSFSVTEATRVELKPTLAELVARIPASHPRLFLRPEEVEGLKALAQGPLAEHWAGILAAADKLLESPPDTSEPPKYPEHIKERNDEWRKIWWGNRTRSIALTDGAATLAFAYLLSGEERYGQGARDLLMAFCEWDPKGSTQYNYNDEAAMPLLYYPARAYTWVHALLSEEERARVRTVMRVRGEDALNDLLRGKHLWTPYDSHDNRSWHKLGEAAIAFLGEIPEAQRWLDYITTVYFTCYPVWGDEEGGWSEGVAYWNSYLDRFMNWVLASQPVLKIDPFDIPFFHQTGYFGLYTLPPGTERGAWGDQGNLLQSRRVAPLLAKLAIGAQNPHWWWYAQAHQTDFSSGYLGFMYRVRGEQLEAQPPTDLPPSRAFHGVGVSIFNTTLLDAANNVQVHFKSSPVGRHSHGYNANNAFMLYWRGKPVFTLTGRRDVHGSPHHREWIWDSRSDNAILVNGEGQLKHDAMARGQILDFRTSEHFDYVEGEAEDSYEGRLNRWTRRMLFFKPSLLVIHDVLEAPEPAVYQWMLHAIGPFELGEQRAHWSGEPGQAQVAFLYPRGLALSQTDEYTTPPADWSDFSLNEWHLSAETSAPQARQQFVTAILLGEQTQPSHELVDARVHILRAMVEDREYVLNLRDDGLAVSGPDLHLRLPGAPGAGSNEAGTDGFKKLEESLRVQHVAGNIYMLEGKGGNIAVSKGPDGLLMVDSQFASEAEKVQQALDALGGELKYLINTHSHPDHVEGNGVFGEHAHVLAHENVPKRLEEWNLPASAMPDEVYAREKVLQFNGEEVRIVHASQGHTDGDSLVYFSGSNVAHLGDQFFAGRLPFIDIERGGSIEGFIRNVQQTISQLPEEVIIIPGHGPVSDLQGLRDFHEMLRETRDYVQGLQRRGLPLEAIQARGLPEPWSAWAWDAISADTYIEILFKGLAQRPPAPVAPPPSEDHLPDLAPRE